MKTIGYAAQSAASPLAPFSFERRELRPNDVAMEILYCGICHTDLHQARNDWGWSKYPLVPGHEIVGRVIEVGGEVTRHKVGDAVAVGCMVDSCQHCDQCRKGEEQLCREGNTQTYNDKDRITGERTYGGYSRHLVVREEFALRVPDGLDLSRAAPLLDVDGTLVIVGQVGPLAEPRTTALLLGRRRIAGSPIGGIAETQEMLDFCARKNVLPDCEMIRMDEINAAFARMERSDVRYRFVIDMSSLS